MKSRAKRLLAALPPFHSPLPRNPHIDLTLKSHKILQAHIVRPLGRRHPWPRCSCLLSKATPDARKNHQVRYRRETNRSG